MKKLVAILIVMSLAIPAYAEGIHEHRHEHRGSYGFNWVAPALISGAVIYSMLQPQPVYIQQVPYWYFCPAANRYFPNVPVCPSGWVVVPTTPMNAPYGAPPQ
jgi:hypothetical protein